MGSGLAHENEDVFSRNVGIIKLSPGCYFFSVQAWIFSHHSHCEAALVYVCHVFLHFANYFHC